MARDKYHFDVRMALEKEGWTITHDPLYLKSGRLESFIDLGAERLIAAEKGTERIAVEVKTFGALSFINAFYEAIGQYLTYQEVIEANKEQRILFLAMPDDIFDAHVADELVLNNIINKQSVNLLIFNSHQKMITQWIQK